MQTEAQPTQRAIVGASEDVDAEYGCRASDHPFTYAEATESEIYSVTGYDTLEAAIRDAKAEYGKVEVLG